MDFNTVTVAPWSLDPSTQDISAINAKIAEMKDANKTDGKGVFDAWPAPYNCYRRFADEAAAQEWINWMTLQDFAGDDAPPLITPDWPFTPDNPPAYVIQV